VLRVTAPDITVPLSKSEAVYYVDAVRIGVGITRLMEF
jgi:hypothetical protein